MKRSLKYILVCLFAIGFASCNNQQTSSIENKENTLPKELYKLQDDFEYVHLIPYDKQTPEQKVVSLLLIKTLLENMSYKNERMTFTMTREEVVALGLPAPYFEVMANNAIEANMFLDKNTEDSLSTASTIKALIDWEKEKPQLLKEMTDSLNYYRNLTY